MWKKGSASSKSSRIQSEEQQEKRNEGSLRDFGDTIKPTNICIVGAPEGK